jgi:hypothetical protein
MLRVTIDFKTETGPIKEERIPEDRSALSKRAISFRQARPTDSGVDRDQRAVDDLQ